MGSVKLVLTSNGAYKIKGLEKLRCRPMPPINITPLTFYNATKAKEAYIKIYSNRIYQKKDKQYTEV